MSGINHQNMHGLLLDCYDYLITKDGACDSAPLMRPIAEAAMSSCERAAQGTQAVQRVVILYLGTFVGYPNNRRGGCRPDKHLCPLINTNYIVYIYIYFDIIYVFAWHMPSALLELGSVCLNYLNLLAVLTYFSQVRSLFLPRPSWKTPFQCITDVFVPSW